MRPRRPTLHLVAMVVAAMAAASAPAAGRLMLAHTDHPGEIATDGPHTGHSDEPGAPKGDEPKGETPKHDPMHDSTTTTTGAGGPGDEHPVPPTAPPGDRGKGDGHEHPTTTVTTQPHTPYPTEPPHPTTTTTLEPPPGYPPPPPGPPAVEALTLHCGTTTAPPMQPGVSCGWTKSTATDFARYRLTRELVGTPRQTIFTTENRDTNHTGDLGVEAGHDYSYIVEAYDGAGDLIGHSGPVHLTCCNGEQATA